MINDDLQPLAHRDFVAQSFQVDTKGVAKAQGVPDLTAGSTQWWRLCDGLGRPGLLQPCNPVCQVAEDVGNSQMVLQTF